MCRVRGRILDEFETVLIAFALCLRGTQNLDGYSSFIPVASRVRYIVFAPDPGSETYVCRICVYDNSNRPRTAPSQ